jgi:hypothetical protein
MARETGMVMKLQVLTAVFFFVLAAGRAVPQQTSGQMSPQSTQQSPSEKTDFHDPFGDKAQQDKDRLDMPHDMQHKLQEARQTERQKRIVADSDRLLALATQLHNDVAKTDKDILSLDVIKRADEIERLAHSVKEHMKG